MREDVTGAIHFSEVRFWARLFSFSFCEYDSKNGFQTGRNTDVMMPVNMDPKAQHKLEKLFIYSLDSKGQDLGLLNRWEIRSDFFSRLWGWKEADQRSPKVRGEWANRWVMGRYFSPSRIRPGCESRWVKLSKTLHWGTKFIEEFPAVYGNGSFIYTVQHISLKIKHQEEHQEIHQGKKKEQSHNWGGNNLAECGGLRWSLNTAGLMS